VEMVFEKRQPFSQQTSRLCSNEVADAVNETEEALFVARVRMAYAKEPIYVFSAVVQNNDFPPKPADLDFDDREWFDYCSLFYNHFTTLEHPYNVTALSLPYFPRSTFPSFVWKMRSLLRLECYSTLIEAVSPDIGKLTRLSYFSVYTSYGIHFLPYEITRTCCEKTHISIRSLYGGRRRLALPRLPAFPADMAPLFELALRRVALARTLQIDSLPAELKEKLKHLIECSVCSEPFSADRIFAVWAVFSIDFVPLLARCCSRTCVDAISLPLLFADGKETEFFRSRHSREY